MHPARASFARPAHLHSRVPPATSGCKCNSRCSRFLASAPRGEAHWPALAVRLRALAPMPESVTKSAAVSHDGWLYVCGGHKGERHDYNATEVSGSFHRLDLTTGTTWESLPSTLPGQGMPLVYRGHLATRRSRCPLGPIPEATRTLPSRLTRGQCQDAPACFEPET